MGRNKAVLMGYYGAANAGDELLLSQTLRWLREMDWDAVVVSRSPEYTQSVHGVEAVGFENLGSVALALSDAQAVIFGGGGIFQDHHPFKLEALFNPTQNDVAGYGRFFHVAKQYGLPIILLGMGVGPLSTDGARLVTRDIFQQADAVTVRDVGTANLLRDIGVARSLTTAPDIGWAYVVPWALHHIPPAHTGPKRLVVVPRSWEHESNWEGRLAASIAASVPDDWQIELVGFQHNVGYADPTTDEGLLHRLADKLGLQDRTCITLCPSAEEALAALARADALISMRLHASIMALALRKPMVALEYDAKMSALHTSVGMPAEERLTLSDSAPRFDQTIATLFAQGTVPLEQPDGWSLSPEALDQLARAADAHRLELARFLDAAAGESAKVAHVPRLDWLALWSQSLFNELKQEQAASRRAHELLAFHQQIMAKSLENLERKLDHLLSSANATSEPDSSPAPVADHRQNDPTL